jgi:hypothetical protein
VKEQSHKSEMGAALRGDFERLRARRESGVLPAAAAPPGADPAPELPPEPVAPVRPTEPDPVAAPAEPDGAATPHPEAGGEERRSWFRRIRDRR